MESELDYFLSQDGLRLYYRHWDCENPKMIVCIVHGLAEHSGRYDYVAAQLNARGVTVFGLDLRGHGISQGKRGHAKSYDLLLSDVEELLKTARSVYTELPIFLLGHSMGGNIVANFVLKKPINELKGFILSSPWLRLAFIPPAWKIKLAKVVAGFWPSLTQPDGLDASWLSRDKQVVKAYENDPLVHGVISAGLYIAVSQAGEEVLQRSFEVSLPGLVFHGNADKVVSCGASEAYADNNELIDWKVLKDTYHEGFNDLGKDKLIADLIDWLEKNIK